MENEKAPKYLSDAIDEILDLPVEDATPKTEDVKKNGTKANAIITYPSVKPNDVYEKETSQNIQDDFQHARATHQEIIEKGKETLEYLMELAKSTDKYEYFDSISRLMKEITDTAVKLMDNEQAKLNLDQQMEPVEKHLNVTNNNMFVGSAKELLDMTKNGKKEITKE